jgi:hypothetical protein
MNLKLFAVKNTKPQSSIQLIVVDLDKSQRYPVNFVCILPRYFRILEKRSSKFAKLFGEKSFSMAKKLLTEAWRNEEDPEVKTVITKRLKEIDQKHLIQQI